jgi:hypothetical protein
MEVKMKRRVPFLTDCCGSVAILSVIMMFVFVGLLAFVIDLAHVKTVKTELSNSADTCALRGARAFLSDTISVTEYSQEDPDPDRAKTQAYNAIAYNKSDNTAFQVGDLPLDDIEVGIWDYVNRTLLDWEWPPPSNMWGKFIGPGVSLPTKRNDSVSLGQVAMTLAKLFGISSVPVQAKATAALSGVGAIEEGYDGSFPIAVDEDKVKAAGEMIFLSPDDPDVGGWTSLSMETASAAKFKGLINHSIDNPQVSTGDWIKLQNGVSCTAIKEAIDYYDTVEVSKGVHELQPPVEVVFPVVQVDTFNQTAEVKGVMAATITYLRDSNAPKDILIPGSDPPKYTGDCMIILTAVHGTSGGLPGGGRWYGLLSTQPKLVE